MAHLRHRKNKGPRRQMPRGLVSAREEKGTTLPHYHAPSEAAQAREMRMPCEAAQRVKIKATSPVCHNGKRVMKHRSREWLTTLHLAEGAACLVCITAVYPEYENSHLRP